MNQSPVPLPLVPALFACLGLALLLGGALAPFLFQGEPIRPVEVAPEMPSKPSVEVTPLTYHDGARSMSAFDTLIGRSPLAQDRSAFATDIAPQPGARVPAYNPQFVGLVGQGNDRSALIIWTPGDAPIETSIGDETPWGTVLQISGVELVFSKNEAQKSLSLFNSTNSSNVQ